MVFRFLLVLCFVSTIFSEDHVNPGTRRSALPYVYPQSYRNQGEPTHCRSTDIILRVLNMVLKIYFNNEGYESQLIGLYNILNFLKRYVDSLPRTYGNDELITSYDNFQDVIRRRMAELRGRGDNSKERPPYLPPSNPFEIINNVIQNNDVNRPLPDSCKIALTNLLIAAQNAYFRIINGPACRDYASHAVPQNSIYQQIPNFDLAAASHSPNAPNVLFPDSPLVNSGSSEGVPNVISPGSSPVHYRPSQGAPNIVFPDSSPVNGGPSFVFPGSSLVSNKPSQGAPNLVFPGSTHFNNEPSSGTPNVFPSSTVVGSSAHDSPVSVFPGGKDAPNLFSGNIPLNIGQNPYLNPDVLQNSPIDFNQFLQQPVLGAHNTPLLPFNVTQENLINANLGNAPIQANRSINAYDASDKLIQYLKYNGYNPQQNSLVELLQNYKPTGKTKPRQHPFDNFEDNHNFIPVTPTINGQKNIDAPVKMEDKDYIQSFVNTGNAGDTSNLDTLFNPDFKPITSESLEKNRINVPNNIIYSKLVPNRGSQNGIAFGFGKDRPISPIDNPNSVPSYSFGRNVKPSLGIGPQGQAYTQTTYSFSNPQPSSLNPPALAFPNLPNQNLPYSSVSYSVYPNIQTNPNTPVVPSSNVLGAKYQQFSITPNTENIQQNILPGLYNSQNLIANGNEGDLELTYLVKRPNPLLYHPFYYIKFKLPYQQFIRTVQRAAQNKSLRSNPVNIREELIEKSSITEASPDLKEYGVKALSDLVIRNGQLVNASVISGNTHVKLSSIDDFLIRNNGSKLSNNTTFVDYELLSKLKSDVSPQQILRLDQKQSAFAENGNIGSNKDEAESKVQKSILRSYTQESPLLRLNLQSRSLFPQYNPVNRNPLLFEQFSINPEKNNIQLKNNLPYSQATINSYLPLQRGVASSYFGAQYPVGFNQPIQKNYHVPTFI